MLQTIADAWTSKRGEVEQAAAEITTRLDRPLDGTRSPITPELLDEALATLRRSYDGVNGGFGTSPKFKPSMTLEHLLRAHARTGSGLELVDHTCRAMAAGGIYDQLAGGFARYSVDTEWVVPHFEKMLYDNAMLLASTRTGGAPEGGFASALDADTDGVEGLTYAWTPAQLVEVLGPDDGEWAAEQFDVSAEGTFEHGTSVLQRLVEPADLERYERVRQALLVARAARPQPGRDAKVVAAWNGLAIAALAEAGELVDEQGWVHAATAAAELEDYGDVAEGLLALHSATGAPQWLELAGTLLDARLNHFDDGQGAFFDTADDAEKLVRRPQDLADGPVPAGIAAAAQALLTYSAMTGSAHHRAAAESALGRPAARGPARHLPGAVIVTGGVVLTD